MHWYVLTHLEMRRFKSCLEAENARRLGEGLSVVDAFYPSDYLRGEVASGETVKATAEAGSIAQTLSRFVFLRGTEDDIDSLMVAEGRMGCRIRLMYYTDTDGRRAIVSDRMMQDFFDACVKYRGFLEIVPPIEGIEAMDRVKINVGPFAGMEASVARVQYAKGAVHLELAIELVNGAVTIKMSNVDRSQITLLNRSAVGAIRTDFIEYTQTHLLDILEHRVKGIADASVRQRDAVMLTRLFRYRHHRVENRAAELHFLALMLICAHLCRFTAEEEELRETVLVGLAEMSRKSESKAATDTRAYLWIALYVATHEPQYRDLAKQYVRDHQPKSERLRHFVTLIRTGKKI